MMLKSVQKLSALIALPLALSGCGSEDEYQAMQACDKEAEVWTAIETSEYQELPMWTGLEVFPLAAKILLDPFNAFGIVKAYLTVTMEHESDQMPEIAGVGRTRAIHPYGSIAKVEFVADPDQPFSGMFEGVECGLVRMSLAAQPTETVTLPGLGMKWLIDEQPSVNFVAMYSLDGQESFNFFENNFSNFIEPPTNALLTPLVNAFKTVSIDPTKVDVSFMAEVTQAGEEVTAENIDAPFQLIMVPNRDELIFAQGAHEFRDDLHTIAAGTVLYTVWGIRKDETESIYIGDVVTKSRFIASQAGDYRLFFRHQRIDDRL